MRSSGSVRMVIVEVRNILVIAAEHSELSGLLRHLGKVERLRWPLDYAVVGERSGERWWLLANGAGRALAGGAADAAHGKQQFDSVLSIGLCGGVDPALSAGEVVVASEILDIAGAKRLAGTRPATDRAFACGCLATVDCVIRTTSDKARIRAMGAVAVDMEAAAVAGRAAGWGIPFYCVRAVSDTADEAIQLDLNACRSKSGRICGMRVLGAAMHNPRRLLPELIHLWRRSRQAADALGDFLADCRF